MVAKENTYLKQEMAAKQKENDNNLGNLQELYDKVKLDFARMAEKAIKAEAASKALEFQTKKPQSEKFDPEKDQQLIKLQQKI